MIATQPLTRRSLPSDGTCGAATPAAVCPSEENEIEESSGSTQAISTGAHSSPYRSG